MKPYLFATAIFFGLLAAPVTQAATLSNVSSVQCILAVDTSTNEGVLLLQGFLSQKGYLSSDSVVGVYGPRTSAAVKKLQSENSIPATGTVGPQTRALIEKLSCSSAPATSDKLTLVSFDMPEELEQDQQGAWILQLLPSSAGTTFTYSALWGDEGKNAPNEKDIDTKILLSSGSQAIFTHTYDKPGRYKQSFNVMSSSGEKVRLQTYLDVVK